MWALADFRNIWLFGAACLFVTGTPGIMSLLYKLSNFLFLLVQVF